MSTGSTADRSGNNFGIIRLVLAGLVVASHAVEGIDGHRSRELLTRMFGTLSFGDLAVDGFFLVSGYLITRSQMTSASNISYLLKRVLRIYPGFIIASLFCVVVVAPAAGGAILSLSPRDIALQFGRMLLLKEPEVPGIFAGLPYPSLNGSMWTIAYEFHCYLMVLLLAGLGMLKNRGYMLGLTGVLLAVPLLGIDFQVPRATLFLTGTFGLNVRFAGIFCCGMVFWLWRDRILYRSWLVIPASIILWRLMYIPDWAEAGVAVLGGYILFWLAFNVNLGSTAKLTARNDISYGLYLYAWPVQNLLIWYFPGISPLSVFGVDLVLAMVLGYISWKLVEQPFLRLKPTTSARIMRAQPVAATSSAGVGQID